MFLNLAVILMLLDLVFLAVIYVNVGSIQLALKFLIFYQFTLDILLQANEQIIFLFFFLLFIIIIILTVLVARAGKLVEVVRHYLAN